MRQILLSELFLFIYHFLSSFLKKKTQFNSCIASRINKYFTKCQYKQIRVNSEALPSLEESYIDDGRVEVDKLEDKHFKCKLVFKLCLGPVHLCNNKTNIYFFGLEFSFVIIFKQD